MDLRLFFRVTLRINMKNSLFQIIFLVWILIIDLVYMTYGLTNVRKVLSPVNRLTQKKIGCLRENGKFCLEKKNYSSASKYFSAILTLTEGMKGLRATEIRCRCGLILADCEIKSGKPRRAIARCTEVINDSLNYLDETKMEHKRPHKKTSSREKSILRTMALAHYRRAMALKFLNIASNREKHHYQQITNQKRVRESNG